MKILNRKRVMSFLLALAMFASLIPGDAFKLIATAVDSVTGSSDTNYGAAIGSVAEWGPSYTSDVPLDIEPVSGGMTQIDRELLPNKVVITDYYYNEDGTDNTKLWYKLDSAPGETEWPTEFAEYRWTYAHVVSIVSENGMTGVFDADGKAVSELTLPLYDKVTLSAESSLQGSVKYQWQIEYEEGKWVDIYGEDGATVKLSYGMVASLLDENGSVKVRCESVSGSKTNNSAEIVVTVTDSEDGGEGEDPVDQPDIQFVVDGTPVTEILIPSSDRYYYSSVLTATTTLTGDLTYNWEVYKSGAWVAFKTTSSIDVTFDPMATETLTQYLVNNETVTLRLTISNGTESTPTKEIVIRIYDDSASVLSLRSMARSAVMPLAEGDSQIATTYNVIIQYLFEDGKQAYAPWSATIIAGQTIQQTVKSPDVIGYAPDQATVELNQTVTGPITITVTYKPVDVKVTIQHLFQPVNGSNNFDDYIRAEGIQDEVIYRPTGSQIGGDLALSRDEVPAGFYALRYDETTVVAATGNTVIKIYYDRIFYLMNFDLDGGYGAEPIYARVGTPLNGLIKTPTKPGYGFTGWKAADGQVYKVDSFPYSTMPAAKTSFVAQWTAGDTTFDIVFWYENADDDGYTQVGAALDNATTAGEKVNGSTYKDTSFSGRDDTHFTYSHANEDVIIKGDGSSVVNVYFTRNVYTMTFIEEVLTCTNNNFWHRHNDNCYEAKEIKIVEAKYDADISDVWLTDPVKSILDSGDAFQWDITDAQVSFMEKMPGSDSTMTRYEYGGDLTYHWYYYLEVLPNQSTTGLTTKVHDDKTYYEYDDRIINYSNTLYLTYDDDYYPITGFEQLYGKTEGGWYSYGSSYRLDFEYNSTSGEYEAFLYYTRESYTLTFSNYGSVVSEKGGTFLFEEDISKNNFIPDYPAALEPGAYVFEGWYESPFFGDTKFDFTGATMPAHNVTLYARWVPKEHTVNIYLKDDLTNQIGTQKVPHRDTATNPYPDSNNPPKHPDSDKYQFVGWFYMDGDAEKAFDFSMPVTKDLDLYAKWSSNVLVDYTVYYMLKGTTTEIADPTTGQALAGTGKTFTAKNGEELYSDYQTGYFPAAQSDFKMDMTVEGPNTYTFYYVAAEEVSYTVKYLEYGTDVELIPSVTRTTSSAIVTENFVIIPKYMPDAYSKTAVVTADGNTEIIFYYTKDEVHAPVHIVHMTQNAVGDGYTIYQEYTDLNGEIGKTYTATILNITGFDFARATAAAVGVTPSGSSVTGTVTENGLEIVIYYDREIYNYEFQFLEQGTNTPLADPVTGSGRYNATVRQNALNISGYDCISGDYQTITIQIDTADGTKNIKVFYYVEKTVDIRYETIGPAGAGYVTPQQEVQVPVKTGTVTGSVVTITPGYKFIGWFYDEACTQPVTDSEWLSGNNIIPQKNADGLYESATYYAKFDYDLTSLTITKTGHEAIDPNQTFIFDIYDSEGNLVVTVTVHGNSSVKVYGLTVGQQYTIVERTAWSWRYSFKKWEHDVNKNDTAATDDTETASGTTNVATITLGLDGTITFTNERSEEKWLDGDAWCDNLFNKNIES